MGWGRQGGPRHRLQGGKSNFVWYRARNDDITANKRQQPYHTYLCRHTNTGGAGPTKTTTGPTPQAGGGDKARNGSKRGGANQKDHRPHSTGGGGGRGDEAKQDQTGKATRPNKTATHLTGKGGYHGVGGGGGVWQPCIIYIYICVCVSFRTYLSTPLAVVVT